MTITSAQATKINKMNRAASDVSMGTLLRGIESGCAGLVTRVTSLEGYSGSLTVTTAMMSASRVQILETGATGGIIWKYLRSGSPRADIKELVWTKASGCLILQAYPPSSASMLVGDEVYWMGFA